jgi:MFS family permease
MEEKEKLLSALDKFGNVTYQQTLLLMAFFGVVFFGDNIENAVKVINITTNKTGLSFAIAVFFAVFSMFAIFIAYWLYYCSECVRLKKRCTEQNLDKEAKAKLIHFSFWVAVYVIAVISLLAVFFRILKATDEATGVFYAVIAYLAICIIGTLGFAGYFLKILSCRMKYLLLGTIAVTVTGILCSQLNCCSTEPEQKKADTVSSACANSNSNKEALTHPPVTVTSDEKICDTVVLQLYLRPGNREYKICQSPIQQH